MKNHEWDFTGELKKDLVGLDMAIKKNYRINYSSENENIEAVKSIEGSKTAPQVMQVYFSWRMGLDEDEIKKEFGLSNKMYESLWKRIRYFLTVNDKYFITKVKLCQNYLKLERSDI